MEVLSIPPYLSLPLILCCFFCLYRIYRGPTIPDRIVGVDFLGMVVAGYCALFSIYTKRDFLMDIALALALLSFIGTLTLAKYLEGRRFDD